MSPRPLVALAAVAVAGLLATPSAALAESPRSMMLELHVGPYKPDVDSQFSGATPYRDSFGSGGMIQFGMHLDYQLFQKVGSLALGAGVKYGWVKGKAVDATGTKTSDSTQLRMLPLQLDLVYRFDYLAIRWGVPLVPYAKGGLTYALWWVLNGKDDVANTRDLLGEGRAGRGGTWGWHTAVGMQILLDWISSGMAREFDEEVGVNNSYLFVEYSFNQINDFGSSESIDLSDGALSFGLMFEF